MVFSSGSFKKMRASYKPTFDLPMRFAMELLRGPWFPIALATGHLQTLLLKRVATNILLGHWFSIALQWKPCCDLAPQWVSIGNLTRTLVVCSSGRFEKLRAGYKPSFNLPIHCAVHLLPGPWFPIAMATNLPPGPCSATVSQESRTRTFLLISFMIEALRKPCPQWISKGNLTVTLVVCSPGPFKELRPSTNQA